jgi:hypothetical protein
MMRQTKARIFGGEVHSAGKLVSLFEPSTEVIRKGKAGKPTEFGKLVKLQEAENQIVIDDEVYDRRPITPSWGACPASLPPMPPSTPPGTGRLPSPWASSASAFPTARAGTPRASMNRKSAGSARRSAGAPERRGASASPSAATASTAAAIAAARACAAGPASASSPTT